MAIGGTDVIICHRRQQWRSVRLQGKSIDDLIAGCQYEIAGYVASTTGELVICTEYLIALHMLGQAI